MTLKSWVVTVTFRFDSRLVELSNSFMFEKFNFDNHDDATICFREWSQKFAHDIEASRCSVSLDEIICTRESSNC